MLSNLPQNMANKRQFDEHYKEIIKNVIQNKIIKKGPKSDEPFVMDYKISEVREAN